MADVINQGWLDITSGATHLHVYFQDCVVDLVTEPLKLIHEVGRINLGIGGGKEYLVFNVARVFLTSHADFVSFVHTLKDWQRSGSFTLGVRRDASNQIQFDGENSTYTVMLKNKIAGISKINPGATDGVYVVNNLIFEQAG